MTVLKAVACDLDGTLAYLDTVSVGVRESLQRASDRKLTRVLVTGRTNADLAQRFPGLTELFEAVIAENGAALSVHGSQPRLVAPTMDAAMVTALRRKQIAFEEGECLLSCDVGDGAAVLGALQSTGLDLHVILNRRRLMVLPSGVTKATGLRLALAQLGVSPHNVAAIGDAQNDVPMLRLAQLAVAVADALPATMASADRVLSSPGPAAVAHWLDSLDGQRPFTPQRLGDRVRIGTGTDGRSVWVQGAPETNIQISGPSGAGKSYLAGLLVEAWVALGYRCLVIDVEGDYGGLGALPGVVVLSAMQPPTELVLDQLLRWAQLSVVVDLSLVDEVDRLAFLVRLPDIVRANRERHDVPHWVVIDEAHQFLEPGASMAGLLGQDETGYLLVTYRPQDIGEPAPRIDMWLDVAARAGDGFGSVTITDTEHRRTVFEPGRRGIAHIRHGHKYASVRLPPRHWFWFTDPATEAVVGCAHNLTEFAELLQILPLNVVSRHVNRGDFIGWAIGLAELSGDFAKLTALLGGLSGQADDLLANQVGLAAVVDAVRWHSRPGGADVVVAGQKPSLLTANVAVPRPSSLTSQSPQTRGVNIMVNDLPDGAAHAANGEAELVARLCQAALAVVDGTGLTGLTLTRVSGEITVGVVYASDDLGLALLAIQETVGGGPHGAAVEGRGPVLAPDLLSRRTPSAWLPYAREVTALGVRAILVFPVQIGAVTLGQLSLFGPEPAQVSMRALTQLLVIVNQLAEALLHPTGEQGNWVGGLLDGPHSVLHQAVGMVSVQLDCSIEDALTALQARAFADGVAPVVTARRVVNREQRLDNGDSERGSDHG